MNQRYYGTKGKKYGRESSSKKVIINPVPEISQKESSGQTLAAQKEKIIVETTDLWYLS